MAHFVTVGDNVRYTQLRMQVRHVAQVQQIVGHQLIVGFDVQHAADGCVMARVVEYRQLRNGVLISIGCGPHPDPYESVTLLDGVGPDEGIAGDRAVAVRIEYAAATRVEAETVIRTLEFVSHERPP